MGTHPIFESDFDCLTDCEMERLCPRCKTTSYRNPSLILMINECGHSLCSSCVGLLFIRGQAPCPECNQNLKKSAFREQMFDDPLVDREVHIRKSVMKVFNKRFEDFDDESDFNNYLEDVEELILGLIANEPWAKEHRDKYAKENQLDIRKNAAFKAKEEETELEQIEMEKRANERSKEKMARLEAEAELKRKEEHKKLLLKIEAGEDLSTIMVERENLNTRENEEVNSEEVTLAPLDQKPKENELFKYSPFIFESLGPKVPETEDMSALGYLGAIRQPEEGHFAAGYTPQLGLSRALTDCFSCLSWKPTLSAEEFDGSLV